MKNKKCFLDFIFPSKNTFHTRHCTTFFLLKRKVFAQATKKNCFSFWSSNGFEQIIKIKTVGRILTRVAKVGGQLNRECDTTCVYMQSCNKRVYECICDRGWFKTCWYFTYNELVYEEYFEPISFKWWKYIKCNLFEWFYRMTFFLWVFFREQQNVS